MSNPYDFGHCTNAGDVENLRSDIVDVKKDIYDLQVNVADMMRRLDALTVQIEDLGVDIVRHADKLHDHTH